MGAVIIIAIILIAFYWFVLRKFKVPKIGSLALISGGVKTGKSTFAVYLAIKHWKKAVRRVKFRNFFLKLFKKSLIPLPLLYSNIPLSVPYVPLTQDLLIRQSRFVYGSVIYICEASLVADSQCIKDKDVNDQLLLFNKLIGHETKGGLLIYDTQCIGDLHYSIKRCLSNYFYIHHLVKWVPFFLLAYVKECRYSDDGSIIQSEEEDTEQQLKRVIIPKSTWKKFDCYCYSAMTDLLPVKDKTVKSIDDLKAKYIVSFKEKFNTEKKGLVLDNIVDLDNHNSLPEVVYEKKEN